MSLLHAAQTLNMYTVIYNTYTPRNNYIGQFFIIIIIIMVEIHFIYLALFMMLKDTLNDLILKRNNT